MKSSASWLSITNMIQQFIEIFKNVSKYGTREKIFATIFGKLLEGWK